MNIRMFTIASLMSILPYLSFADGQVVFNRSDFVAAEKTNADGETTLRLKLSKSGKAKVKKLNQMGELNSVHSEIAGVISDFKFRGPVNEESVEMGPYSQRDSEKILTEFSTISTNGSEIIKK